MRGGSILKSPPKLGGVPLAGRGAVKTFGITAILSPCECMGFGVTIHERRTHGPCVRTGQWGMRLSYSAGAVGSAGVSGVVPASSFF